MGQLIDKCNIYGGRCSNCTSSGNWEIKKRMTGPTLVPVATYGRVLTKETDVKPHGAYVVAYGPVLTKRRWVLYITRDTGATLLPVVTHTTVITREQKQLVSVLTESREVHAALVLIVKDIVLEQSLL